MPLALAAAGLAAVVQPSFAEKTSIRAVSCFPKGHSLSADFEAMIDDINKNGKGLTIQYVGGAPAIGSPFTVVQNVSKGVFDLAFCPNSYYQNVLPEADALKLIEKPIAEIRKNGGFDYIEKMHEKKGLKLLGRLNNGLVMHLYLRTDKPISKADLSGLQLRAAPIYGPFFQALGATTVQTNLTEVYNYMESKTVDGYGFTAIGLLPDWYRVTGYRVDPGFYDAGIEILISLDTWKELSGEQQKMLNDFVLKHEASTVQKTKSDMAAANEEQQKKGIKIINFTGAERDKWVKTARDIGWESVIKLNPTEGKQLRKFFASDK
jgi:TRAP-type C4-dicarboxylate transport system substrate-binding protein